MRTPTKPTVFISYSHQDEPWKDRLVTHLGVLQRQGLLDLWDDRRIGAGADWRREIRQAMDRARVAVLLVSADFLTSDFILGEEVPRLLQRRDQEDLRVFPVIVRPCAWQRVEWLARMQARPRDGRPLSAGDEHQVDVDLAAIAEEVAEIVDDTAQMAESERSASPDPKKGMSVHWENQMPKPPQVLLDFTSDQSMRDWGTEEDNDLLAVEHDTTLKKLVLVKKGRGFEPSVKSRQFNWGFPHYELTVRLEPESYIYVSVLDETGKERTLVYGSAPMPGLNPFQEFVIRLSKELSDGMWHSLTIDLSEHMEQARWPGFVKLNWLSLRGEVSLAGIRGCDDKDLLMRSAIAEPYVVSAEPVVHQTQPQQGKTFAVAKHFRNEMSAFYALLIGVGDYLHPRFANLPATVRDAQALAGILTDPARCGYPSDNVRTITGSDATGANVRAALERLAASTTPDATAFVYFSGHGGRAPLPSPDLGRGAGGEGGERWRAYLCPREANPDDLPTTAISGDAFSTMLAAIPARRLLVMLDACHAAGSATLVQKATDGTPAWKAGLPESYYEALSRGSGRVVIASSKEDQFSRVRPQGDLSLFTYHLREALGGQAAVRGDGLIHVLDVFHHVNEAVQADEPEQTPVLKVDDLDLNFPIAVAPAQAAKAPQASTVARDLAAIREQIVREPIAGARALSAYLAGHPELAARRNEVDLKRSELERIQHDLDLFGPDPSAKAAKNRAVFFLLRTCLELEQSEQSS